MDREVVRKYLDVPLGEGKYTSQVLKYNCPKPNCDQGGKYNLEINLIKSSKHYKKFHCWSCHYKGNIRQLFKDYAISDSWNLIRELQTAYEIIDIEKTSIELPSAVRFYLNQDVKKYLLEDRCLNEDILIKRKVLYCYDQDNKLFNNIIFPFYDSGELIGYSSQNFLTKKYKNHRDLNFIPYKDFININYPIIVTEGVYDALSVPNAIPMLGTKPSKELLKFSVNKKIILALDNEVSIEDKKSIAEEFKLYGASIISIFETNQYKDLNDWRCKDRVGLKSEIKILFELLNEL